MPSWFTKRCHSILFVEYRRSDDALGLYRIAFASVCLFLLGTPRYAWIAKNPAAFFDPPPGLARLASGFPPAWTLYTLDWSLLILFVALLVGWRTRAVSAAITVLILIGNSFRYSLGKIDHDILFVLTPLIFAGSWGRSFSIDTRQSRRNADRAECPSSLAILACLIAFGFLTAGLPKLLNWLDFDLSTQGVRAWVLRAETSGRSELLLPFFRSFDSRWGWELLDVAAVTFEVGFVFALFAGPRVWNVWMGLAALFHLGNYLMINISFAIHLPLYLAFADWAAASRFVRGRLSMMAPRGATWRIWLMAAAAGYVVAVSAWQWASADDLGFLEQFQLALPLGEWRPLYILGAGAVLTFVVGARALVLGTRRRHEGLRAAGLDRSPPS